MANVSSKLLEALSVTFEIVGSRTLSAAALRAFAEELAHHPEPAVLDALARCKRESRGNLTLADVLARIDDGHPGVEEAWSLIPPNEDHTAVWTQEIAEAWGAVRHMLESDEVAARMAFKEIYSRLVTEARTHRRPAKWNASLGHTGGGDSVIREAVKRGRLSQDYANRLLGTVEQKPKLQIAGPETQELSALDPVEMVRRIREQLKIGSGL